MKGCSLSSFPLPSVKELLQHLTVCENWFDEMILKMLMHPELKEMMVKFVIRNFLKDV